MRSSTPSTSRAIAAFSTSVAARADSSLSWRHVRLGCSLACSTRRCGAGVATPGRCRSAGARPCFRRQLSRRRAARRRRHRDADPRLARSRRRARHDAAALGSSRAAAPAVTWSLPSPWPRRAAPKRWAMRTSGSICLQWAAASRAARGRGQPRSATRLEEMLGDAGFNAMRLVDTGQLQTRLLLARTQFEKTLNDAT